jgi:hypothetical protein
VTATNSSRMVVTASVREAMPRLCGRATGASMHRR